MKAVAVRREAADHELAGRVLCQDVRGDGVAFRKGHTIVDDEVERLRGCAWEELHLLELDADDVGQREAGERLARALASEHLQPAPSGHKHVLRATRDGLLKVDAARLQRLNGIAGVAVFTARGHSAVKEGEVVAEAQITPLAIGRDALEEAERVAAGFSRPVVELLPFVPRRTVIWARDERLVRGAAEKLRRFGCEVDVRELPRDAPSIRAAMDAQSDASLFVVSGSNALDPLDPVFVALEQWGATMRRRGMPVHPGTLLWLATRGETIVVGLPSCGRGMSITSFDLILPRLLAEGAIADEELAALGHGGIL